MTTRWAASRHLRVGLAMLVALSGLSMWATSAGAAESAPTQRCERPELPRPEGASVVGVLISSKCEPVVGVDIEITKEGGEATTITSDDEGLFVLELGDETGNYTATLIEDTLPDDVVLTDPDALTRTFRLTANKRQIQNYPFGESTRQAATKLDEIPGKLVDGVQLGLIIAMCAIGLSLIYGTIQLTNFSHGEMVTFGAIVTWFLNQNAGLPLPLAGLLGVVIGAASGAALELGLWRPLRRKKISLFGLMTVSFGLSLLALNVFQYVFGARNKPYTGTVGGGGFELGSRVIPARTVITIVIAIVVLGAVAMFLRTARFGKAMRAVADNPALAASSGIDVDRVVLMVWVMGAGLAALGGVLYSTSFQVNFQEGQQLLLLMFAGITLGGLGTAFGAAAGCFVLGLAIQMSTLYIPTSLRNVGALVVLIVVLMFAPQGIFGRRERVG